MEKLNGDVVVLGVGSCPDSSWHYYNATDSCFYVSTTAKVDQPTARQQCKDMSAAGVDLLSIYDRNEHDFVSSISYVVSHGSCLVLRPLST